MSARVRHLPVLQDVRVASARTDPKLRFEGALAAGEVPFLWLDRLFPPRMNPFAQTGAIANVCFIVAAVSGVLLLLWYSASLHQAWTSLDAMRGSFFPQLVRSVHRYSSDACMLFVLLHAVRLTTARRFAGARWLAWVTGIVLVSSLWLVGWLGYWLVWDAPAGQLALGTAKVLDVLPIFGDPMGRSFLTDKSVHSLLFFTVFFCHMLLPLAMGVALWLHITRLNRAKFLTDRAMTIAVLASLLLLSVVLPATSGAPARMGVAPSAMRLDAWYLLPIALTDRLSGGLLWLALLGAGLALFSLPWLVSRGRAAPAVVELPKCNGCTNCATDCPYDAITMQPRSDGRSHTLEAVVDPAKCVGCGICAGSCDSAGIGVPAVSQVDARARIDAWIDDVLASEAEPYVAFACARSAAESFAVDLTTGTSAALPGYRVMPVVCAGWVHALTIERAIRHGARGVLIVSCGGHESTFREGPAHTAERLAGERAPGLRQGKVDAGRVRLLQLDRTKGAELSRAAEAFRRGEPTARPRPRYVAALATSLALVALVGAGSRVGYAGVRSAGPELVVSFKHAGRAGEQCHTVTAEEKAKLPPHMRTDQICARGRANVRLRVEIDGVPRLANTYAPKGASGDGPSVAVERLPLTAGLHRVSVAIGESHDPAEWTHRDERTISFSAQSRLTVLFDRVTGFTWEGP